MGLDARLRLARLYLCTDAREQQGDLPEFLAAVLAGGVDVVQIREPGMRPDVRRRALATARAAAVRHQALVGVDGSPALAAELGADLLHLDQAQGAAARSAEPRSVRTCSSVARPTTGTRPPRPWPTRPWTTCGPVRSGHRRRPLGQPPVGLDLVRHLAEVAPVFSMRSKPWFAAGGIIGDTLDLVLEAGARRVCVATAITGAPDPQQAAEQFSARLRAAWRSDPAAQRYTFAAAASTGRP